MRIEVTGPGLARPLTITGDGVAATDAPRMDITFDFGPALDAAGIDADGETRFVLDGRRAYVDPPEIPGFELPDGATWVTVDLKRLAQAFGVDPDGLREVVHLSPQQQLAALEAAGSMKEVGEEEIDGVRTTHLRGTVSLRDYARALPPERRRQLDDAIRRLADITDEDPGSLDGPMPTDMWVDEDAHVRRMTQSTRVPAQPRVPAGSVLLTIGFDDFGTPLDLDLPEGDEVFDATGGLAREIRKAR